MGVQNQVRSRADGETGLTELLFQREQMRNQGKTEKRDQVGNGEWVGCAVIRNGQTPPRVKIAYKELGVEKNAGNNALMVFSGQMHGDGIRNQT